MPVDPAWTCQDLAKHLCDDLVAKGQLKDKPAFIRTDREERIAQIFESLDLDGRKIASFDNPGPLEMAVRKGTQGEAWVEQVIAGLIQMLPPEIANAEKQMNMDEAAKEALSEAKASTMRRRERFGKGGKDREDEFPSFGGKGGRTFGGYGREQECFNCGGYGHISRECPEPRKGKGRGSDQEECFNCGGYGHISRECPEPRKGKGKGSDQECFNCGQLGHLSRECPEPRRGKGGGKSRKGGDQECFNCGGFGHISRECPEPRKGKGRGDYED